MTANMANLVLSFDIGTKNFAYCLAHCKDGECLIESWSNVDLRGDTAEECTASCVAFLKEYTKRFADNHNTYVLIERQVPQNTSCMCISHAVFAFFLGRFNDVNVSFMNAKDKPLSSHGTARKAEAVKAVTRYLNSTVRHTNFKRWFEAQKKKDDLADCLLQILGNVTNFKYKPIPVPIIVIDD
jgi:hypothetical protein